MEIIIQPINNGWLVSIYTGTGDTNKTVYDSESTAIIAAQAFLAKCLESVPNA